MHNISGTAEYAWNVYFQERKKMNISLFVPVVYLGETLFRCYIVHKNSCICYPIVYWHHCFETFLSCKGVNKEKIKNWVFWGSELRYCCVILFIWFVPAVSHISIVIILLSGVFMVLVENTAPMVESTVGWNTSWEYRMRIEVFPTPDFPKKTILYVLTSRGDACRVLKGRNRAATCSLVSLSFKHPIVSEHS